MNRKIKKALASFLAVLLMLTSVPLGGFAGLDIGGIFATKAAAASYSVGDIIEYGNYPQSRVTDSATLTALDGISKSWQSYGYYSGTGDYRDGQMKPGDYMKYADLQYGGSKYRAIYFTAYRPDYTGYQSSTSTSYTYQSTNGYYINTTYYFKYEPLKWRVLDPNDGLIMCESIIDSQAYQNTIYFSSEYWQDSSKSAYANDYAKSSIRKWLNDDFYNTAFNDTQKSNIETTALNNDCYSSSYPQYNSAATNDKIFLLSYNEVKNSAYGFSSSTGSDSARRAKGTDYAKCQGLYSNVCSWWWLRSPDYISHRACDVDYDGDSYLYHFVYDTRGGVRPACKLSNLKSDISQSGSCATGHRYTAVITAPTCTKGGFTTYTCECGDTYIGDEVIAHHTFGDWKIKTPASCTENGEESRACSFCGEVESKTIPALDHDYSNEFTVDIEATSCLSGGTKSRHCSRCDSTIQTITYYLEHDYEWTVKQEANVFFGGYKVGVCKVCGNEKTEYTEKKPSFELKSTDGKHTLLYETEDVIEPGTTFVVVKRDDLNGNMMLLESSFEGGLEDMTSFDVYLYLNGKKVQPNGYVWIKLENPIGIDFGDYFDSSFDICHSSIKTFYDVEWQCFSGTDCYFKTDYFYGCDECNHKKVSYDEGWDATCITDGRKDATYCDICGDLISGGEIIPATGHTDKGNDGFCDECGEEMCTHSNTQWVISKLPSLLESGMKFLECIDCHVVIDAEFMPKTGIEITDDDFTLTYEQGTFDEDVELNVEEITEGSMIDTIAIRGYSSFNLYDITITKDGVEVQPDGRTVLIKVPVPVDYDPLTTAVYHIDKDNNFVKMNSYVENGFLIFEANHFSPYVIVDESKKCDHLDQNQDGICDNCEFDKTIDCSCNCHKTGIVKFFWSIINFFQKLFGQNKICACGKAH